MTILSVRGVGKAFRGYRSEWHRFARWFGLPINPVVESRVLNNISFDIKSGEAIGIVGQNGAGKSTLLKIITGTLQPTEGVCKVNGRIAAILELGMGFNPDLTGRENVRHAAGLMGHGVRKIDDAMAIIEEFADVGVHFDYPVRTYSTGMYVRVAFAIAIAWRPDILIVDEALSVGDILFQQKCMKKIQEYRSKGTSLIFVTHDFSTLTTICDQALLLSDGKVKRKGTCKEIIEEYFNDHSNELEINQKTDKNVILDEKKPVSCNLPRIHSKYISDISVVSNNGVLVEGDIGRIIIRCKGLSSFKDPHVGIRIQNRQGTICYETNTFCQKKYLRKCLRTDDYVRIDIKFNVNLPAGEYTLAVGIENIGSGKGVFEQIICPTAVLKTFQIIKNEKLNVWSGSTNLHAHFELK
ncbi:ABC transporter ATP-binding protein [Endozoicomonas gorgoniicola]|uniref:ABC transporter ATP-binding protein n=1 Tax=Endozoicomonas gorgoniicola TaxID=1234144 RepID=A0ABT3MS73_9GAMM|nr:ABC transporter ATP-binding protein [Endozoicomonas gorgoniicola]MCW7552192.1 ABC transporter ATP-binding protein [Endozoicomonas gorgoniicola]